ncbi:hypothetical protein QBC36DRAFT_313436 [Triangularia setosa]|uniref:Uncharacterized protein n=1 Tax=Triangularia setosa TaxID=2587417 RepID=A0AAN7A5E2_9PEZI|nr:hypothetical protein QBC36DRAFT_313436 [Podospora setosa]
MPSSVAPAAPPTSTLVASSVFVPPSSGPMAPSLAVGGVAANSSNNDVVQMVGDLKKQKVKAPKPLLGAITRVEKVEMAVDNNGRDHDIHHAQADIKIVEEGLFQGMGERLNELLIQNGNDIAKNSQHTLEHSEDIDGHDA